MGALTQGFMTKCAEAGIDPGSLIIKTAQDAGNSQGVDWQGILDKVINPLKQNVGAGLAGSGAGLITSLMSMDKDDSIIKTIIKLLAGPTAGYLGGAYGQELGTALGGEVGKRVRPAGELVTGEGSLTNPAYKPYAPILATMGESPGSIQDAVNQIRGTQVGGYAGAGAGGTLAGAGGNKLVDLISSLT